MTSRPFPLIRSLNDLDALKPREWVECAKCMEIQRTDDPLAPDIWAWWHLKAHPGHDKFRIVSQRNFSVSDDGPEPELETCGATTKLAEEFLAAQRGVVGVDWADVVVTCSKEPHGDDERHGGPLPVGDPPRGVYFWSKPLP